eukprot:5979037-Prymnesium_polylepis.1
MHPADLDAALQLFVLPRPSEPNLRLPFSVKEALLGNGVRSMWAVVDQESAWLQKEGAPRPVTAMHGMQARAMRTDQPAKVQHLYTPKWQLASDSLEMTTPAILAVGHVLEKPVATGPKSVRSFQSIVIVATLGGEDVGQKGELIVHELALILIQQQAIIGAPPRAIWLLVHGSSTAGVQRQQIRSYAHNT